MSQKNHEFESAIMAIFDHLYATSNIKLPEELSAEVTKVLLTIQWARKSDKLPDFQLAGSFSAKDIKSLFSEYVLDAGHYKGKTKLVLDDRSLIYLYEKLSLYEVESAERDWLGDALEVFRAATSKRLGGQFFTDQRVTDLAVEILNYRPDKDLFVDTCAGTGGFLIAAAKIAKRAGTHPLGIKGIELDSTLSHMANSTLQNYLESLEGTVFNADSLTSDNWSRDTLSSIPEGSIDIIASNPPFGTKITIKDEEVLSKFDLGHVWGKTTTGWSKTNRTTPRAPDILFLERNLKMVKPGTGKIALVLPYQILSGPKTGYIREWLLRNARVLAVIDLPDDTFQPWTGTKTSLLVAERRTEPLETWNEESYPVFMSIAEEIGHDRRGKPVLDQNGKIVSDLPEVALQYQSWSQNPKATFSSSKCFLADAAKVTLESDLRLNAAFFNPSAYSARENLQIGSEQKNFRVERFGDLVEHIFCPGRFTRNYVEEGAGGIPFLGGANILHFSINTKKYLSKDDPNLGGLIVREGWLLITRSGSTGIVSSVPEAWDGAAISEHVIRVVPDESKKISAGYLEAYLRSELGQELLAAGVFGSVIDEITPEQISELPVPIPLDESLLKRVVEIQILANKGRQLAADSTVRAIEEITKFHKILPL